MAKHRKPVPSKAKYYVTGLSALGLTLSTPQIAAHAEANNTTAITQDIMNNDVWDRLAQCESSGNWSIESGNPYSGGLQFASSTWREFGGTEFAPRASQATREEQISVATRVQQIQGWKAWPTCTRKLGISGDPGPAPSTSNRAEPGPTNTAQNESTQSIPKLQNQINASGSATKPAQTNPKCVELKIKGIGPERLSALNKQNPDWQLDGNGNGIPCEITFPRSEVESETTELETVPNNTASTVSSSAIVNSARTWIGTPYKWGGTTLAGLDCSALVQNVLRANGIKAPRVSADQARWVDRISRSEARPGDLVFGTTGGRVTHVGIYTGNGMMIDAPRAGLKVGERKLYSNMTIFGRVPGG